MAASAQSGKQLLVLRRQGMLFAEYPSLSVCAVYIHIIRVGPIVGAGHLVREACPTHRQNPSPTARRHRGLIIAHHELLHVCDVYP